MYYLSLEFMSRVLYTLALWPTIAISNTISFAHHYCIITGSKITYIQDRYIISLNSRRCPTCRNIQTSLEILLCNIVYCEEQLLTISGIFSIHRYHLIVWSRNKPMTVLIKTTTPINISRNSQFELLFG